MSYPGRGVATTQRLEKGGRGGRKNRGMLKQRDGTWEGEGDRRHKSAEGGHTTTKIMRDTVLSTSDSCDGGSVSARPVLSGPHEQRPLCLHWRLHHRRRGADCVYMMQHGRIFSFSAVCLIGVSVLIQGRRAHCGRWRTVSLSATGVSTGSSL